MNCRGTPLGAGDGQLALDAHAEDPPNFSVALGSASGTTIPCLAGRSVQSGLLFTKTCHVEAPRHARFFSASIWSAAWSGRANAICQTSSRNIDYVPRVLSSHPKKVACVLTDILNFRIIARATSPPATSKNSRTQPNCFTAPDPGWDLAQVPCKQLVP